MKKDEFSNDHILRQKENEIDEIKFQIDMLKGNLNDILMSLKGVEARMKSVKLNTQKINSLVEDT